MALDFKSTFVTDRLIGDFKAAPELLVCLGVSVTALLRDFLSF